MPAALPDSQKPVAVQYCTTFLKPEMLHIYRQIVGMREFRSVVFTQKREEAERFPFEDVEVFPRPSTRELRRLWYRKILNGPVPASRSQVARLETALQRRQAAVLHLYFGHVAAEMLPWLRVTQIPTVVSFHGADSMVDLEKPRHRQATVEVFERTTLVIARSESLLAELVRLGCPQAKTRIHRTGIPLDRFPFTQRMTPSDGRWRLFQACRLIPKKGLHTTLQAFSIFMARFPMAELTIAGEGPLLSELEELALSLRLPVRFLGFLSQSALREELRQAHLFVHPSEIAADGNREGVPNAMLEAMATGLPVVATTHGGIPEAVTHGTSGFLTPERDAQGLARSMLELAADPNLYERMSRAAAAEVQEKFELKQQAAALGAIYREAIAANGGRNS